MVSLLEEAVARFRLRLHGYVLMEIDYHLMVETPTVNYSYDPAFKRLTGMADAVTGNTSFSYNSIGSSPAIGAGLLASVVNTGGAAAYSLSYGYDGLARVVSRVVDGGTTLTTYDAMGRVSQENNPIGTGTFSYAANPGTNQVDEAIDLSPAGQVVLTSTYSYFTSGASDEVVQTVTNTVGSGGTNVLSQFGYGYDAAGDVTSWTQQTGTNSAVSNQYGYDGSDKLLSAVASSSGTQSSIDAYAYLYDAVGNRTSQQINNSVMSSAYNTLNQVTSQSGGGLLTISGSLNQPGTVVVGRGQPYVTGTSSYNFSAQVLVVAGSNNIQISATNVNSLGVTKTLTLTATNGTAVPQLTYNLNGNLTYDGSYHYGWDSANRLVAIWYGAVGTSGSTTMAYDGLGRRVQIVESSSNGTVNSTKNLVWDGMTIREERNASNAVTKMYFNNGVQIGGTNYYYTKDHLGSVREVMTVTGTNVNMQTRYDYDSYGQQTLVSGTAVADFGFTGLYSHQPSGLLLAPYREYSSPLGRWISRDPIYTLGSVVTKQSDFIARPSQPADIVTGGVNLYEYVMSNPVNLVDPLGLKHCCPSELEKARSDCNKAQLAAAMGAVNVVASCGPAFAAPELAFWTAFRCVAAVHIEAVTVTVAWDACHQCDNQ